MQFDGDEVELRSPGKGDRANGGVGDAIEAQTPVVGEFGNVLIAVGLFAPAVEVVALFVQGNVGVVDGEGPNPLGGVLVGEPKGLLGANVLIEGLSPLGEGGGEGLGDVLPHGQGEFAAFEEQFGEEPGFRELAGVDERVHGVE